MAVARLVPAVFARGRFTGVVVVGLAHRDQPVRVLRRVEHAADTPGASRQRGDAKDLQGSPPGPPLRQTDPVWSNHWCDVWDIAPETYDVSQAGDNVTFDVQVRLFPDEQQGFFTAPMSIKEEFEGYERELGHSLVWWGFDLHDRVAEVGYCQGSQRRSRCANPRSPPDPPLRERAEGRARAPARPHPRRPLGRSPLANQQHDEQDAPLFGAIGGGRGHARAGHSMMSATCNGIAEELMSLRVWNLLMKEQMVLVPGRGRVPIGVSDKRYEPMPRSSVESEKAGKDKQARGKRSL